MTVFFADEQDDPVEVEPLRDLARRVMLHEGFPPETEVSVILVGETTMADYNERFMDRKGPTDVLAFPLEELDPARPVVLAPNDPPLHLGDVFISPAVVRRDALAAGVPFDDEMALMVVHGILHLVGYDHVTDAGAEAMEALERELLGMVGRKRW